MGVLINENLSSLVAVTRVATASVCVQQWPTWLRDVTRLVCLSSGGTITFAVSFPKYLSLFSYTIILDNTGVNYALWTSLSISNVWVNPLNVNY